MSGFFQFLLAVDLLALAAALTFATLVLSAIVRKDRNAR